MLRVNVFLSFFDSTVIPSASCESIDGAVASDDDPHRGKGHRGHEGECREPVDRHIVGIGLVG